jgi:chromosome segregation ATPase
MSHSLTYYHGNDSPPSPEYYQATINKLTQCLRDENHANDVLEGDLDDAARAIAQLQRVHYDLLLRNRVLNKRNKELKKRNVELKKALMVVTTEESRKREELKRMLEREEKGNDEVVEALVWRIKTLEKELSEVKKACVCGDGNGEDVGWEGDDEVRSSSPSHLCSVFLRF